MKISVEHIFPQNHDESWNKELQDNQIIENYSLINCLGNLSITNDNSALSNRNFEHKKRIFEERSYLKINKFIYEKETWNKEVIIERMNWLLA